MVRVWKVIISSMFALQDLVGIFVGRENFAWEILYSEIALQASSSLHADHIKTLIELYSFGMEKLNQLQQTPNNYFKTKINDLMGQKRVIRCLNDRTNQKRNETVSQDPKPIQPDLQLQTRRREMEIRLAYDIENSTNRENLCSMIDEQKMRESQLQRLVHSIINKEELKLEDKIRRRQSKLENVKSIKKELLLAPQRTVQSISQFVFPSSNCKPTLILSTQVQETRLQPAEPPK